MTLADGGYPLLNVTWSIFVFFAWVVFFSLLFMVYADLFRRHDIGGWAKAGWIVLTLFLPYIGVFIYVISQGNGMSSRTLDRKRGEQAEMDRYVRSMSASGNTAVDDISKAKQLLDDGAITDDEFAAIKRRALAT